MQAIPTSFERGWNHAVDLWKSGLTWELITHKADEKAALGAFEASRGMIAAVDAMSGWHDLATREAKAHGVDAAPLIERMRLL
jgi:hypothetical protein